MLDMEFAFRLKDSELKSPYFLQPIRNAVRITVSQVRHVRGCVEGGKKEKEIIRDAVRGQQTVYKVRHEWERREIE